VRETGKTEGAKRTRGKRVWRLQRTDGKNGLDGEYGGQETLRKEMKRLSSSRAREGCAVKKRRGK